MRNNRQRILADVISLDAWHDPFQIMQDTYGVYAEVSFSEGRLGGDNPEIPFTFHVSLKRALLTIHLEEPLQLERSSVSRGIPNSVVEYTRILRAKNEVKAHVGAQGKVTNALFAAAIAGDISKSKEMSSEEQFKITKDIPEILVTARPEGAGGYSWEMEPLLSSFLKGQPWNPAEVPRMRVKIPKSSGIDPTIRVEVRCALEDMEIKDLQPKNETAIGQIKHLIDRDINRAAAIQHLKKLLMDVDLVPGRMDNRFSSVIIADVMAVPS